VNFPFGDLPALDHLLKQCPGQVAAVFIDVCGSMPPEGYLPEVQALTRRHGALLVMDEVVTGFRVAPGGAQQHLGVKPDLACFAKAIEIFRVCVVFKILFRYTHDIAPRGMINRGVKRVILLGDVRLQIDR
jgi:4-aminobutyrate aminotransferase-like enzyme